MNESTRHTGQAWWTVKLRQPWSVTAIAAFDSSSALAGAALRYDVLRGRHVTVSPEAELGVAWASVALPASVSPFSGAFIYTAPRIGNWGDEVTPFIPLGISGEIIGQLVLRGEVQVSWADFQYYNRRVHWGLAAAHQW